MNYLNAMTVKQLRTLASDMGIKGRSTMDKVALVGAIGTVVNVDHDEAIEIHNRITLGAVRPVSKPHDRLFCQGIGASRRVENYRRQNGSQRLTAKQLSRVEKKIRKEASYSYV